VSALVVEFLNPSQARTHAVHLSLVVCHGQVGKNVPYLLHGLKTLYFPFLLIVKFVHRGEGLWGCGHAACPCGSECFVQVVLGWLDYPCSVPRIHFPLAGSLVNVCSIKLTFFHFVSSDKCLIHLTPLLCYLKQEQSIDYCKLWGAVSLSALVLQHPCDAFTVFLVRETKRSGLNKVHCITESVQMKIE